MIDLSRKAKAGKSVSPTLVGSIIQLLKGFMF